MLAMLRNRENLNRFLVGLILAAGTVILYLPVRHHEFVWLDDPDYVTENAYVRMGLAWESVSWAFTHSFSSNWHPLTWLSHMLDWQLFGPNAGGHHLASVVLHAANSVILFLFLRSITGTFWRAAFVAALFAWHPTHVESVAWVSERKDVLSTFFGLLSLWAYATYAEKSRVNSPKSKICYVAALVLFACGLMSKPMLVTWPFVMLLLDFWPLGRLGGETTVDPARKSSLLRTTGRLVAEKLPFFALVLVSCVVTVLAQDKWHSLAKGGDFPLHYRLINADVSYLKYVGKLFWPANLAAFYPFPSEPQWELATVATLVLVAISGVVIWRRSSAPFLLTGWFWFLGTLVPVIGLMQVGGQSLADRYTYIPSIGWFIAIVWSCHELTLRVPRREWLAATLASGTLLACVILSARQIAIWKNSRTLFEHANRVTTGNFLALSTLGEISRRDGNPELAIQYFRQALACGRSYPGTWCGLGMALFADGQRAEGINCLREALKLNADDPQSLDHLGVLLLNENQPDEAEIVLRHALEVRPGFAEAHSHLGMALEKQSRGDDAIEQHSLAVKFKPEAASLRLTLASTLARHRRFDQAMAHYRTVLTSQPRNLDALLGFAGVLMETGKLDEAAVNFETAVMLSPTNALALDGLGAAQAAAGRNDQAALSLAKAVALAPTNAFIRLHFGMALQNQGRVAQAAEQYRTAISLDAKSAAALNNLAWLLATSPDASLRNGAEAAGFAQRACELTENREPLFIGTLAAAYAEAGRFPEAIAAAEKARDLAKAGGLPEVARRNTELLELYRAGKPWREKNLQ